MKAIEILTKFTDELQKCYDRTSFFNKWEHQNNDIEIIHDNIAYFIDYSIAGNREVHSSLKVMSLVNFKFTSNECDNDLKNFIESSFNQLLPILFDELLASEEERETEEKIAAMYQKNIEETYESLQNFR